MEHKHIQVCYVKYDVSFIWPWPWPNYLDTQTQPRYGQDVSACEKWSSEL